MQIWESFWRIHRDRARTNSACLPVCPPGANSGDRDSEGLQFPYQKCLLPVQVLRLKNGEEGRRFLEGKSWQHCAQFVSASDNTTAEPHRRVARELNRSQFVNLTEHFLSPECTRSYFGGWGRCAVNVSGAGRVSSKSGNKRKESTRFSDAV